MENLDINEEQVPFIKVALTTGLILGGINVAGSLVGSLTGSTLISGLFGVIVFFGSIYLIRKSTIDHMKNDLGGFMSFKRAFNIALISGLVMFLIALIFNYFNLNYINPSQLDDQLAQTEKMMSKFGMPEDALEQAMEDQKASLTNPLGILKQFGIVGIFWALICLIFGAVLKKIKPFFNA
jgi:Protein of unknown function (DUF4199)